ncbi:MAG TPA: T9SS type A sorting domain-containing protein [Bacteroidota bacterium]
MKKLNIVLTFLLIVLAIDISNSEEKKKTALDPNPPESANTVLVPNTRSIKQGFSMRMWMDNRSVFGRQGYPGGNNAMPAGALGLEYPLGQPIEHIFGGGIWVGGLLDTSTGPTPQPPVRAVTFGYEGWSGQLYEFYPGDSPADTFWRASKNNTEEPPGWSAYWGNALPFNPISDNDLYCTYTDYTNPVSLHLPLRLRVIQSCYAWDDPYADAIIILEYKIINEGVKKIDSAYIAWFFEADVGPLSATNYPLRNFTGYYPSSRTAYIHNPADRGSTPVGGTLLQTPIRLDSLRYSFRWYPGPQTPTPDAVRYNVISSGVIQPDEYPALSDTRFLFAFGPFTINPRPVQIGDPLQDTLKIAMAIVSGFSQTRDPRLIMQRNAARALDIYLNQGIQLPPTPPSPPLRAKVGFRRVELDWKWQPGDDILYGRPDPETNWDSTNQLANRDPSRRSNPPPGYDSTRGGRNFESYKLWRSETPPSSSSGVPDESYTLIRQTDMIETIDTLRFGYDTGLEYSFVDSNLVRGKIYTYAVTSESIPNLAEVRQPDGTSTFEEVEPLESGKRTNAFTVDLPFAVSEEVGKVSVVPNPYRTDRSYTLENGGYEGLTNNWDETKRVIKFINLPGKCIIRVFSLSGDLIRTVDHDGTSGSFPDGDENMTLVSDSNRALASGIYVYTVESEFGTQTGKFVIIR